MRIGVVGLFLAVALAGANAAPARAGSPDASPMAAPHPETRVVIGPSGLPVPRFVALKKDEVIARFGPSFDYPIAATYRQRGLPLKVIAETRDDVWRRVEDQDGGRYWIHRSMLMGNDNAVVRAEEAVLRAKPSDAAPGRARLTAGVMAEVEHCEDGWCRLRAGSYKGWLPQTLLWGVGG
ncbi:SH3 domain-containing protein [Parvularcula dongshanensis]|uniref:SH3-like domain-containing protein n=1 Tax=Parvularcula dongshanensis TaxID=1173995 RepID=A0A840HZC6_9PROT|nr:SH3 domain-containing protein [Parvularcula dongshanensis]MBB4658196.1 SH3-like domain-containing protein [Parvularcula dongshanensis]